MPLLTREQCLEQMRSPYEETPPPHKSVTFNEDVPVQFLDEKVPKKSNKVVEETPKEERPDEEVVEGRQCKDATVTNKVTRAALLKCALFLCMLLIACLVYDTMQFNERITRAMAKTPTTRNTLPIHLRREEANVRPPVPTTKFDVAAEALSVAKQCSIGWIPGMYDELYLWGWPLFPFKRCVGSAMGGAGKAVKRVFY